MDTLPLCIIVTFIIYMLMGALSCATATAPPSFRLDGSVVPHHYDLEISTGIDQDDFRFWGAVRIQIICMKDTYRVVLHSRNHTIQESDVTLTEGIEPNPRKLNILSHSYNETDEFYILETEEPLRGGKNYTYTIPFAGLLNEGVDGFYRSYYDNKEINARIWLATTQFQPIDARHAFPCFDEPRMKATFTITIGHLQNYHALSNMPLEETTPMPNKPGWLQSRFAKSIPMPTYLVCFVISDFIHRTEVRSTSGVTFRIWARPDSVNMNHTAFAEDYSPRVLDFFENYYQVPFPLTKIDMIAIPHYKFGAMENWGLITYVEDQLLYDPETSTLRDLQGIATTIAHELAHQWFGNIVTMEWWNDLWLNEAFASYYGLVGTHAVIPEWNIVEAEMSKIIYSAFQCNRSIEFPAHVRPNEVDYFSRCTYTQGPVIMRMMQASLGEDALRTGLIKYLDKHKGGNVRQEHLYEALTEGAHEAGALHANTTIKMIMEPWIKQIGYPLLMVHRNYTDGTVSLTQQPFSRKMKPSEGPAPGNHPLWWIPLTYTSTNRSDFSNTTPLGWFSTEGPETVPNLRLADSEWIIFNLQVKAPYKVYYNRETWILLQQALLDEASFSKIHPNNRREILQDIFNFADLGSMPYTTAFAMTKYLQHETDPMVLSAAYTILREIDPKLRRTPNYELIKKYLKSLVEPTFTRSGSLLDVPTELKAMEKKNIFTKLASYFENETYEEEALRLFKMWLKGEDPDNVKPVPKEIRRDVYCTAVQKGTEEEWDFLWTRYLNSNLASEKSSILSALTCARKVWILLRFLNRSIDKSYEINPRDSVSIFEEIAENKAGFPIAKDFLFQRLQDIHAYHGPGNIAMGRYVKPLTAQMIHMEDFDHMKSFIGNNAEYFKNSATEVEEALRMIQDNAEWYKSFH